MSFFSDLEAKARHYNDFYNIGIVGTRGDGEKRDAFRHAFTTIEIKRWLIDQGMDPNFAAWQAFHLGAIVEMANLNNYQLEFLGPDKTPLKSINDLNMDLWNNAQGSLLSSISEADSAAKIKSLLDQGKLITTNTTADSRSIDSLNIPGTTYSYADDANVAIVQSIRYITTTAYPQAINALNAVWSDVSIFLSRQYEILDVTLADLLADFKTAFASLKNSPIVVDLQNNGLSLISRANAANNVFFDMEGKGFAKDVGWIAPSEAFLVRDVNGNGVIDNVTEMFGDNGGTSAFAKLKALDTNNNNTLTGTELASLRLWVDADGDGVTDAGELKALSTYNIAQIDVTKQAYTGTSSGNSIDGFVNIKNGGGAIIAKGYDVFFDTDGVNSWYVGASQTATPAISATALLSPLSRGYGDVKSLHYALTENTALKTKLDAIEALPIATQMTSVDKQITELLTLWAGKTGISATSANVGGINGINGQTFEVVQAFAGQDYVRNGSGSLIPDLDGSLYLHRAYGALMQHIKEVVLVQSVLKDVFVNAQYSFMQGDVVLNDTLTAILDRAFTLKPTDSLQAKAYWGHIAGIVTTHAAEFGMTESAVLSAVTAKAGFTPEAYTTYLLGTASVDAFRGTSNADMLDMLGGNDTVTADSGNDTVLGGAGNDSLEGQGGNDSLAGGTGGDMLSGGANNDIYAYVKADGADTVYDNGGSLDADVLVITNYASTAAVYTRVGNTDDFRISFTGTTTDSVLVTQGLEGGGDTLEQITFASGGGKTIAQVRTEVLAKQVTTGADTIVGISGVANTISGGAGNDTLTGKTLADRINGDAGNDTIDGGNGNDSLFGGDNDDRLDGGADNDSVEGGNGNDSVRGSSGNDRVLGNAGNDTINADSDNDTVTGGLGKDQLTGGSGLDMFVFAALDESRSTLNTVDSITDFSVVDDRIDLNILTFTGLDTDGGNTETNELRTYYVAASNTTFIRSDQTGFEIGLVGADYTATLTNSDFIW
jgi:RTX calcium-binding nonapeptide repeat (4 copies)